MPPSFLTIFMLYHVLAILQLSHDVCVETSISFLLYKLTGRDVYIIAHNYIHVLWLFSLSVVYCTDSGESPPPSSQEAVWKHRSSISRRETARSADLSRQDPSGASPSQPSCLQEVCWSCQLFHQLLWYILLERRNFSFFGEKFHRLCFFSSHCHL